MLKFSQLYIYIYIYIYIYTYVISCKAENKINGLGINFALPVY